MKAVCDRGNGNGLWGATNGDGAGVYGTAAGGGFGVLGESMGGGPAVSGRASGTGRAGYFQGDVEVTGRLLGGGADCAEEFDLSSTDTIEPGTVMVLNQSGNLEQSYKAYDKKVAGIVSGGGNYKPALVLDKKTGSDINDKRIPVALMGKVYCKVYANYSPIEIGDLLTTSDIPGHAMKANDPLKAFGAVIGNALKPLLKGQGLIPVLVTLQ